MLRAPTSKHAYTNEWRATCTFLPSHHPDESPAYNHSASHDRSCGRGSNATVAATSEPLQSSAVHSGEKRIAIIGLGAAGISALRALVGLPKDLREGFIITAFDDRESVGGLWVPQDTAPVPPLVPKTALYPGLRTNGPHPTVTVPNTTFEPETPLLAPRDAVWRYWQTVYNDIELPAGTTVKLQHAVTRATWVGSGLGGEWHLNVLNLSSGDVATKVFDHLIAAPGPNHVPHIPTFVAQDQWLERDSRRVIMHAMWYRDQKVFQNRIVLILGGGPSGLDLARHSSWSAQKVFWSRQESVGGSHLYDSPKGVESVPTLHLINGTALPEVDFVILATGYEVTFPFLQEGGLLDEVERDIGLQPDDHLTTNSRYVRPLYESTLSLDPRYPLGSLFFVGILRYYPTGLGCYAQGLFAAYTIARPSLLGPRSELLASLRAREARVRAEFGVEMGKVGHRVDIGYGASHGFEDKGPFQDLLVHSLREHDPSLAGMPGIPPRGFNYTERWRAYIIKHALNVTYGWHARLDSEGEGLDGWEGDYARGLRTEADYLDAVSRFLGWLKSKKVNSSLST
ncbi:FAD/NAD(P)-binding domain-containing protein [Auriculariales sp. MPI-PUGE-AT-0066]|nr:FAD/NAD(P)-binding domain-containing protein [Auriculariales sp. MPI-PUGE-AT-0066]